jgi:hypothetical protein
MKTTLMLLSELRELQRLREDFQKWWDDNKLDNILLISRSNIQERFDRALAITNLPTEVKDELITERDRLLRIATLLHDARELWNGREP